MNSNPSLVVGIAAKPLPQQVLPLLNELQDWLAERHIAFLLDHEAARMSGRAQGLPSLSREELARQADLLVVLGGDGTLLSVARHANHREVPLLGVNLGSLGFLTEIGTEEMFTALQAYFDGKTSVQKRMLLSARLLRGDRILARYQCLNDVVVTKAALARIIHLRVGVGGTWLTDMRSDGLIVATPTGSTAYNLSAGGPILVPGMNGIILTPLCPHTLTMRPLIVDGKAEIEVTLLQGSEQVYMTGDGQVGSPMEAGDRIVIRSARHHVNLILSPRRQFFGLLREKLGWGSGYQG
ncbi:MAG: NAD(+)/NADH kinase [Acidobacteriota bacterium]